MAPPAMQLSPYLIQGKGPLTPNYFRLGAELGDGSFGKVYEAKDVQHGNRTVALKIINIETEEELEDFQVEIDILKACDTSYVIKMYDAYLHEERLNGVMEQTLWLSLELVGGGALDDIYSENARPLTEREIKAAMYQIVKGMEYLHMKYVIHRDLKCGNVLLTMDGHTKLCDFGVSALCTADQPRRTTFIGTPYWMAPEVIVCETNPKPYSNKCDVWSLGITTIECAEMEPPLSDMLPMRALFKIPQEEPPQLEDHDNEYSNVMKDFIGCCLKKDPAQRPSCTELLRHKFLQSGPRPEILTRMVCEYKGLPIPKDPDAVPTPLGGSRLGSRAGSRISMLSESDGDETELEDGSLSFSRTNNKRSNRKSITEADLYKFDPKKTMRSVAGGVDSKAIKDAQQDMRAMRAAHLKETKAMQRDAMKAQKAKRIYHDQILEDMKREHEKVESVLKVKVDRSVEAHNKDKREKMDKFLVKHTSDLKKLGEKQQGNEKKKLKEQKDEYKILEKKELEKQKSTLRGMDRKSQKQRKQELSASVESQFKHEYAKLSKNIKVSNIQEMLNAELDCKLGDQGKEEEYFKLERDIAVDYEETLATTRRLHHSELCKQKEAIAHAYYDMLQKQLRKLCDKEREQQAEIVRKRHSAQQRRHSNEKKQLPKTQKAIHKANSISHKKQRKMDLEKIKQKLGSSMTKQEEETALKEIDTIFKEKEEERKKTQLGEFIQRQAFEVEAMDQRDEEEDLEMEAIQTSKREREALAFKRIIEKQRKDDSDMAERMALDHDTTMELLEEGFVQKINDMVERFDEEKQLITNKYELQLDVVMQEFESGGGGHPAFNSNRSSRRKSSSSLRGLVSG